MWFFKWAMLFHLYVFWVIMLLPFDRLPGNTSSHSHTVVDIQFPLLQLYLLIDPPDGPSLFIYGNTLPFTTNSTFVKIVICQQKYLQSKLSKSVKYTTKIAQRCYIQSCYITDIFTERATHFRLSSGRHMHAWLTYV